MSLPKAILVLDQAPALVRPFGHVLERLDHAGHGTALVAERLIVRGQRQDRAVGTVGLDLHVTDPAAGAQHRRARLGDGGGPGLPGAERLPPRGVGAGRGEVESQDGARRAVGLHQTPPLVHHDHSLVEHIEQ